MTRQIFLLTKIASSMAEEGIREKPPDTKPQDVQFSDILLIMDKIALIVQALSEVEKNGKAKTVPADKKHENSFLKFDRSSGILQNFIKNFWSQLKDPTRFRLIRMTFSDYKKNREVLKDLAEGKQTDRVAEFLQKYEIRPKEPEQQQSTNNKNDDNMAKQDQNNKAAAAESPAEAPKYRFNESLIDWDQLKNFGISKEFLQEKGLLDSMLKGYKTNQTVPVALNFGSAILRSDARLSFQQSTAGPVVLAIHGIRKEPELDRPFFGHNFSDEDKKNLRETGNMGRVAELKTRNGEYAPSFISIDKLTKEVVAMRVENVYIPDEIKNVKLTDQEKNDLREGKAIYLEGMKAKSGNDFNSKVQINADRRGIEFLFDNDRQFNRQNLGGVDLTEKQVQDLHAGKSIFVEDMKRTDGEYFSSFVKLDEATGRPTYTRYNPDSPEGAREIYVPKEMSGVMLTPDDRQQLREGKPVFLENMINRKGEEFSSFVKLDLETGRPSYSKTPDGFSERQDFKVPAEVMGVTLSATQRAGLQDGKAVLIEGIKGFDGKTISQYGKVNQRQGKIDLYNENPDRKKEASQRTDATGKNDQQPEKKEAKQQEKKPESTAKKNARKLS